ncbi:CRISPR-associated helicase/endonuclease Cas3 [Bacillaceae bacterium SAOS 7]|nr:CRISPR-associated helicase/endonuclease Cas3 [Bacillaceae bacterium SAOS 7]
MFYAKSLPEESIYVHTEELWKRYQHLYGINKNNYLHMSERDWQLLEIAVKYHDVGKADAVFQNKIRGVLNKPKIPCEVNNSVPHNFISVAAIPYKKLGLTDEESKLIALAVGFHHERKIEIVKKEILDNYKQNMVPLIQKIEQHMNLELPERPRSKAIDWLEKRIMPSSGELFFRYVMIKGLLHRLDHSASAHVAVELADDYYVGEYVNRFFIEKLQAPKRKLQIFTEANQQNHVLAVAQTGMGKTEAALLWIGKEKGFFTLPLRTSINAMYKRLSDPEEGIGFTSKPETSEEQAIGLLHSTSLDYLYDLENETGAEDKKLEIVYEQSKHFANKLIISTIDQILKFPFYYNGFEKELATMAGAKIVIDEMQSYDPKIAALVIRALELIDKIGGKFMIMTATMPDLYIRALEKQLGTSQAPLVKEIFYDDQVLRHHLQIHHESILEKVGEIKDMMNKKKVLVICNTVQQAKEMYQALTADEENLQINLLHSQFIRRDRAIKENGENGILKFATSENTGIWVTTQLVEASLDIDFDVLYTEMSPLDSLFQRLGRCNRKGKKKTDEPNAHIFMGKVSGVGNRSVYHPEIYERSADLIQIADGQHLLESEKMTMIEKLYDTEELEGTTFKEEFEKTLYELNHMPAYQMDKQQAQDLLRDIQQVQVIPQNIFQQEAQQLFHSYEQQTDKNARRKIRRQIEQLTVGVNRWKAQKYINQAGIPKSFKELYVLEMEYSVEYGVNWDKEIDPFS